ncbi:MAG: DUF167 domain-containing protein [Cyanobacteria bacterium M_surface_9_m1_291]|nr:DUF167 domain-containing protein [Cyanobacteria bacterium M_surface_9_m1_291]
MSNPDAALAIWLQPRGSRNQVLGEREGAIVIKLQAPPVDGAANAALLRFVAQRLGVTLSSVALLRGYTSRHKLISVAGWSAEAVRQVLLGGD